MLTFSARGAPWALHAIALAGLLFCTETIAQQACPRGNLLAGLEPRGWRGVYRMDRVTDGVAADEGEEWASDRAAGFGMNNPGIIYDLARPTTLRHVLIQGSGLNEWCVDLSGDGRQWFRWWCRGVAGSDRLTTSRAAPPAAEARYVRVYPTGRDGRRGLSELQVSCTSPDRADLRVAAGRSRAELRLVPYEQAWRKVFVGLAALAALALASTTKRIVEPRLHWLALGASCAALGLSLGWTFGAPGVVVALALAAAGAAVARRRWRGLTLATLALVLLVPTSMAAWTNFGRFWGSWTVHYHDAMHYFLGAKYAPELGYSRFVVIADIEGGHWPVPTARTVRDLRTNDVVPIADILRHPALCKDHFSQARWRAFRRDVSFFQAHITPSGWSDVLMDHGYNATPAWTLLGRSLALRDRPASQGMLAALAHCDEALFASLAPLALWGFGVEAAVLALLIFALGSPWVSSWVAGSIGRAPWLVFAVGARGRSVGAGVSLGFAIALQAFPVFLLVGPTAALVRRRPVPRDDARLVLAAALTAAALLGAAALGVGTRSFAEFAHNTAKHAGTLGVNRLGLRTVITGLGVPTAAAALVRVAGLAAAAVLAARRATTWERLAAGTLIPFVVFDLASYYGALAMCWAALCVDAPRLRALLLLLTIASQLTVLPYGGDPGMAYYVAASAVFVVAGFGLVAWRRGAGPA
jgi:hypothetical protein